MRKKRELHGDLPPTSDPNYHKLWREKHKAYSKQKYKEWLQQQVEENPNYWADKYDPEKASNYRKDNRPFLLERQWRRRGIIDLTFERYEFDLRQQNYCCAICNKELQTPHADHDHTTGFYRAILCVSCNNGLGIYEKNKDKFDSYLRKHKK